jgi:hypothetical protein
MITIEFMPEEKELFTNIYYFFIMSDRMATRVEELPRIIRILTALQAISNPIDESRLRSLKEKGGKIELQDDDRDYLKMAISPPHAKWTNDGIPMLMEALKRLDSKEEKSKAEKT